MDAVKHVLVAVLAICSLLGAVLGGATCCVAAQPAQAAMEQRSLDNTMSLTQASVLGVVEGLTEYLPVSSTGHLLLAQRLMAIGGADDQSSREAADAYAICIQIGAILAVFGLYFCRVKQMARGVIGRDAAGRQLLINVVVGFMPAAVIGLLFNKLIKAYLFGTWPVIIAWFVGGVAILAVSWYKKRPDTENTGQQPNASFSGRGIIELTWRLALVIGFAQCIAMWPGVSRSLVTIVAGVLVGLSLAAAVEFSFLLGLITLGAATAYDALKHGDIMLQTFDGWALAVGVIWAFLAALVSVKWMVGYLNRHGLAIFGYYRIALSLVAGVLLLNGVL